MMSHCKKRNAWVLMIPVYVKGHIDPLLFVAKQLLQRGIRITFIIDRTLTRFTDSIALASGAELFELVQLDPLPEKRDKDGNMLRLGLMEASCTPYLETLVVEQKRGRETPTCIVADMCNGWVQVWAAKLRVPWYNLFSSSAGFALVALNVSKLISQGLLESKDKPFEITGISKVRLSDFPATFVVEPAFYVEMGDALRTATGVLINTSYELEQCAIDAMTVQLANDQADEKVTQLLPIGPMMSPGVFSGVLKKSSSEYVRWLDTQAESSVIYVAFGSLAILAAPQVQELAVGLESSGLPFLWALRCRPWSIEESSRSLRCQTSAPASVTGEKCDDLDSVLPPGFQSRTHGRGMVTTGLVPQLEILSHPAVAGIVTHCGWNSSLESISTGCPLVAWPLQAEQRFVCRFLVDAKKIAIEVVKEANGYVHRNEVEKALTTFTTPSVWKGLKDRIAELRAELQLATADNGSSQRTMERFVMDVMERC